MLGSKVQPGLAVWNYRISANLLGKPIAARNRHAHLEIQLQGESGSQGSSLRFWPDTTQTQTLHGIMRYLRVDPTTKAILFALPDSPIVSLAMQHRRYSNCQILEIIVLKDGIEAAPKDTHAPKRHAEKNGLSADRTRPSPHCTASISYCFELPNTTAQDSDTTASPTTASTHPHPIQGYSIQKLTLTGFQPTPIITHTEHALTVPLGGLLCWHLDYIAVPSISAANVLFSLPETHLQLTDNPSKHKSTYLSAVLSSDCTCLHRTGVLRLQLKLQAQNRGGAALPPHIDPTMLHQIEVTQGQGNIQFTQAIGPWSHLSVNARIMPKKGLLLGPFPTLVTPNLAPTLNIIDALQALPATQFPLNGLSPLKPHKQHTQLRIIAHANLWVQASVTRPLLVRTLLHFCLGSTPLFSLPLAFRPADDTLGFETDYSEEALTQTFTTLIEDEYALIAQKLVHDRYALACYLVMFTDVLDQLNPLCRKAVAAAQTQGSGWPVFWQALHRLATYQSTTQGIGSVSHSNKVLHEQLNQITQIFCRNATHRERPTGNKVPLSAEFYPMAHQGGAKLADPNASKSGPAAPQITSGCWAQAGQQLHLNLNHPRDLQWVRHYRINLIQQTAHKGIRQLINSQCYLPMLLGQTTSGRLSISLPKLWDNIKDISIQLLTYGDPAIYETPAVTEFNALTEDLTASDDVTSALDKNGTGQFTPSQDQQSMLRPWIAHLSADQIRLKWQTHPQHLYTVEIQDAYHQTVITQQLDGHSASTGVTLDRKTFKGEFPYQLWVSITPIDLARPQQIVENQNSSQENASHNTSGNGSYKRSHHDNKAAFEPVFVHIPSLTVFRDTVQGRCLGCHWEKPQYPVSYYQAELFEIQNDPVSEQENSAPETALALPCFQTQLPATEDKMLFESFQTTLKKNTTYEFRLRAKLPDDNGGLFAWTPATVVTITPDGPVGRY